MPNSQPKGPNDICLHLPALAVQGGASTGGLPTTKGNTITKSPHGLGHRSPPDGVWVCRWPWRGGVGVGGAGGTPRRGCDCLEGLLGARGPIWKRPHTLRCFPKYFSVVLRMFQKSSRLGLCLDFVLTTSTQHATLNNVPPDISSCFLMAKS